jgi:hypothetical protein
MVTRRYCRRLPASLLDRLRRWCLPLAGPLSFPTTLTPHLDSPEALPVD